MATISSDSQDENEVAPGNVDEKYFDSMNPNTIKNILRSFFQFLVDKENKDVIYDLVSSKPYPIAINVIKKYIKKYKFNNTSLMRLIKSEGYKRAFEYYLTFDISNWLQKSKIVDAESHRRCIEKLKECCAQNHKNANDNKSDSPTTTITSDE